MSEKKKRRRWTASEKLRVVLAGTGRLGGDQRAVPPGGDQPDAVLRLEEAAADFGGEGVRRRPGVEAVGARAAHGVGAASGEGRDRGDHGREPGPKKRALGLEDHGQLPAELQRQVHAVVARDEASQRLAGAADLAAVGRLAGELLPVADGGAASEDARAGAAAAGAGVRSDGRGEAGGAELRLKTSGDSPSRAGLADGGRGGGVLESVDGVPDFEGGEPGLSLAKAEEADQGGRREGAAAGRDLGDAT